MKLKSLGQWGFQYLGYIMLIAVWNTHLTSYIGLSRNLKSCIWKEFEARNWFEKGWLKGEYGPPDGPYCVARLAWDVPCLAIHLIVIFCCIETPVVTRDVIKYILNMFLSLCIYIKKVQKSPLICNCWQINSLFSEHTEWSENILD